MNLLEEGWPGLDNRECLSECPVPGKGKCHLRIGTKWLIFLKVPGVLCSPPPPPRTAEHPSAAREAA